MVTILSLHGGGRGATGDLPTFTVPKHLQCLPSGGGYVWLWAACLCCFLLLVSFPYVSLGTFPLVCARVM